MLESHRWGKDFFIKNYRHGGAKTNKTMFYKTWSVLAELYLVGFFRG